MRKETEDEKGTQLHINQKRGRDCRFFPGEGKGAEEEKKEQGEEKKEQGEEEEEEEEESGKKNHRTFREIAV